MIARRFVGKNLSLAKLALTALHKLNVDFTKLYGYELPPELLPVIYGGLLYGASHSGIMDNIPTHIDLAALKTPTGKEAA